MEFGIIGAGRLGQAFARYLLREGYLVKLSNSRGPQSLAAIIDELGDGTNADVTSEAAAAPIVLLAVPWNRVEAALMNLPPWSGRILIDATNPYIDGPTGETLADLGPQVSSEIVAALAPGARVVKALNTLDVERFEDGPIFRGARRVQFISGDDDDAKREVGSLLRSFGFSVIDLGSIHVGGFMQRAGGAFVSRDLLEYFHQED